MNNNNGKQVYDDYAKGEKKKLIIFTLIITLFIIAAVGTVLFFVLKDSSDDNTEVSSAEQSAALSEVSSAVESDFSPSESSADDSSAYSETEGSNGVSEDNSSELRSEEPSNSSEANSSDESRDESSIEENTDALNPDYHGMVINKYGYTYIYEKNAYQQFNGTATSAEKFAAIINNYKKALGDINIYNIIAPTSVDFVTIPRDIKEQDDFYNTSQESYIKNVGSKLDEGIVNVNVRNAIALNIDNYMYFHTDKNWTADAAHVAYAEFAVAASIQAVSKSNYSSGKYDNFLGSFHSSTGYAALKSNPDYINYYQIDELYPCTVTHYSGGKVFKYNQLIYRNFSSPSVAYYTFLGGEFARTEIVSENTNGKKLLVIGDSSAAAFVPFTAPNYQEIYFINTNYYSGDIVAYAREKGVTDLLFLSYATSCVSSTYTNALQSFLPKT